MTGPLGNSEFCFPWISMFPSTSSRETLRFSGNKIHCSPWDQSLSVYYTCILNSPWSSCIQFFLSQWQFWYFVMVTCLKYVVFFFLQNSCDSWRVIFNWQEMVWKNWQIWHGYGHLGRGEFRSVNPILIISATYTCSNSFISDSVYFYYSNCQPLL